MKYTYAYKTSDGARHEASIEAASRDAAFAALKARGIRPSAVRETPGLANKLFGKITENIFMAAVYSGRISLDKNEVLSYLRFLQKEEPQSLPWSENTLDTTASKYLSTLRNLVLLMGPSRKVLFILSLQTTSLFTLFALSRLYQMTRLCTTHISFSRSVKNRI